jgi:hypothetical protein
MNEDAILAFTGPLMIVVIAVGIPLVRALSKKWEREAAVGRSDPAANERLARMEAAIDAMAVEIERISEGQRFVTKLLAERGEREKVALPGRERVDA